MLFVCTGNTCRSPMAEALLRARAGAAGLDLVVGSAGTLGWSERPPTPHAVAALAERDVALVHTSRRVDVEMVESARLVVAMTREHAYGIQALAPDAVGRVFLFGELLRTADQVGPWPISESAAGVAVGTWVDRLDELRGPSHIPGRAVDEIADPAGEGRAVYERTAERLAVLVDRLVAHWPTKAER